jgi:hypothetical protein
MAEWFAPKRYGFGSGWPIAWQGWALIAGFLLVVGISILIFGPEDPLALAVILPAAGAFLSITARTTRGGWRWRWGGDE